MQTDVRGEQNRFLELSARAAAQGRYTRTPFLTLAQQDVLRRLESRLETPVFWMGGYDAAERRLACFGREEELGYPPPCPIVCLRAAPVSPKFAGRLEHRDFLGSLMGLGIRREVLGDVVPGDREAWLFCLEEVAPFLRDNLTQVGRTPVTLSPGRLPEALTAPPEPSVVTVASPRLDGLIAAVFHLSRGESQQLFPRELVFVDGRLEESPSRQPPEGAVISVRGHGRFRYDGPAGQTRKGRAKVQVRIY